MIGVTHNAAEWASISREDRSADGWVSFRLEALSEKEVVRLNESAFRCRQSDCGGHVEFVFSISRRASRTRRASLSRMYICRGHANEFAQQHGLQAPGVSAGNEHEANSNQCS